MIECKIYLNAAVAALAMSSEILKSVLITGTAVSIEIARKDVRSAQVLILKAHAA